MPFDGGFETGLDFLFGRFEFSGVPSRNREVFGF